jgi:mannosylglycerate hydrolase
MDNNEKLQLHFISNTHWDREWRYSAQRTRYMLGYLLDMIFDIFEKEPEFKHFHLDSQTMPIQDYLEAFPEKAEMVRKYVSEGKLAIGPWFCLPDEFCLSGESLVRNLLLGHKIARKFGGVSKTGYSPFGWGQISQMPQIYMGFGIDVMSFYRGLNHYIAPKSEFIWEGPDGTRILASRLGARPRYNVWYILQRPAYWNQTDENNRTMSWKTGNAPFRFIDEEKSEIDYQYAHPMFNYYEESIPVRAAQAISEQDNDWTQPHRFWSSGHDSSCPDIREVRMIEDCNKALGTSAHVFHSTVKALQEGIKANLSSNWPVLTGEMHNPFTKGSVSELFGWIISSRMDIKQDNFRTERELISYAEPMAVFSSLLGAPYPANFIDLSYNYLLQNHGHDSIAGCGRDIVSQDVIYRYRQSRELSCCIMERAMMDIAGDVDLSSWSAEDMALVVYNPSPFTRSEVMNAVVEIPTEWNCKNFEIVDMTETIQGEHVKVQICEKTPQFSIIQSPNDTANVMPSLRFYIRAGFKGIPGMGYKTFKVRPVMNPRNSQPITMKIAPQTMENEYMKVAINSNGTLDIFDKTTKENYKNLGYFRDGGEIGNPWQHNIPQKNSVFTTLNQRAEITLIRDGELEVSYRVKLDWSLPEGRSSDESTRSSHFKPYEIINIVTLKKGQKWVEIVAEIDNTVEDHYLQVSFPTGIKAEHVMVQGQFDVIKRPVAKLEYSLYDEIPMTEQPMNSFVDYTKGDVGMAFLNEGLKAYEAHGDQEDTLSLTLLRCYPLRICVTTEMQDYSNVDKGSQCLGKHIFRYGIMPHRGDHEEAKIWAASEQFNLKLQAAQIGPTKHGKNPLVKAFLELKTEGLHVSAVKRSEDNEGWIVRLFNPFEHSIKTSILLNGGFAGQKTSQSPVERVQAEFSLPKGNEKRWKEASIVNLEEIFQKELLIEEDGSVEFEITKKKILTLKFS